MVLTTVAFLTKIKACYLAPQQTFCERSTYKHLRIRSLRIHPILWLLCSFRSKKVVRVRWCSFECSWKQSMRIPTKVGLLQRHVACRLMIRLCHFVYYAGSSTISLFSVFCLWFSPTPPYIGIYEAIKKASVFDIKYHYEREVHIRIQFVRFILEDSRKLMSKFAFSSFKNSENVIAQFVFFSSKIINLNFPFCNFLLVIGD